MTKASCHNCVYACWDLGQAMQSSSSGWPSRPVCANHADAPGRLQPTPLGRVCRNYRARPATPEGDVKRIPLTGGFYAYVDAADYEWLSKYSWRVFSGGYAMRCEKGKVIFMHRRIMQPPEGMVVDHIDGNRVNDCRFNLRVCTPAQNRYNHAKRAGGYSRFKGVSYHKKCEKCYAVCQHKGGPIWLGYFDDEVEAARAYDHKAVECCGPFARVNLPEEWPPERVQQVYADAQASLKREAAKGAKSVKGQKARAEEEKRRRAGKGRQKEGKRQHDHASRPDAGTQRSKRPAKSARATASKGPKCRTRVARRKTKSSRRCQHPL